MPYTIETKTGVKGPFNEEHIQEFYQQGKLKAEHQVTDQESGQRIAVSAILQGQKPKEPEQEESVFIEDDEPTTKPVTSTPNARGTRRNQRSGTARTGTGRQTRRRQQTRSSNHYAAPDADENYQEDYPEEGGSDLVYKCFKPLDKVVMYMWIVAIATLLNSVVGLFTVISTNGLVLAKLLSFCFIAIPFLIGYKLITSARNIREGMRLRKPNSLHKGAEDLALTLRISGAVLLVLFVLFAGIFLFAFAYYG